MNEAHPDDDLPLLASGQLDETRRGEVEAHIAECARCRSELELLEAVREAMCKEAHPQPPLELGWQRLRRELDGARPAHQGRASERHQGWLRLALAASLAIIVLQSGFIVWEHNRLGNMELAPLSAERPGNARWQVQLAPNARAADLTRFLRESGLELVSGPSSLGLYRLAPRQPTPTTDDGILSRLRAHPELFSHVAPISG